MKKGLKRALGIVLTAVLFLLAVVGGFLLASTLDLEGIEISDVLLFLVISIVLYYVSIASHEAGHLVFGLLTGYSFSSYRIGSFMWIKKEGKIYLKRMSLAGTGGQCLMIPPEPDREGRIPDFFYNMGGAIVNLLLGAVLLLLHIFVVREIKFLELSFLLAFAINILMALFNGLPISIGGINNDGKNAISLGKSRSAIRAFRLQLVMNSEIAGGRRLREMPEEWFSEPTEEEMQNPISSSIAVFRCNRILDEHRFSEANEEIIRLLNRETAIVGMYRRMLECDRIFCELMGKARREVVDSILDPQLEAFMQSMRKFPSVIRTRYAIALLHENNKEKAENIEKIFEKYTKSYPYEIDIKAEKEFMNIISLTYLEKNIWASIIGMTE